MNLAQLRTAVDSILIRDDIGAAAADFARHIRLAEAQIARTIRPAVMMRVQVLNMTAGSIDLPADFLEVVTINTDTNAPEMQYMVPDVFVRSAHGQSGRGGAYYTLVGGGGTENTDERMQLMISGNVSVSAPVSVVLCYLARFAPLVADADTNWLLLNHFDAYLYATLRAAAEWVEEDELEMKYQARFDRIAHELGIHENRRRYATLGHTARNSPRTVV